MLDVAFADQLNVIDQLGDDGLGERAGRLHRNAFRDGVLPLRHGHALDGRVHGRKAFRLHAHDLDAGFQGLGGRGHP
ncbi:hypothetical protein D3C72_2352080 [compost metagenome]